MVRLAIASVGLLLLRCGLAAGGAVSLGKDDFDEKVFKSGKNAFVKFLAPW